MNLLDNIKSKIYQVFQGLFKPQSVIDVPKSLAEIRSQPIQARINQTIQPLQQQFSSLPQPITGTQTKFTQPSTNPIERINTIVNNLSSQTGITPITQTDIQPKTFQQRIDSHLQNLYKTVKPKVEEKVQSVLSTLHQVDPTTQDPDAWINSNQGLLGQARRWSFENLWDDDMREGQALQTKVLSGGKLTPEEGEKLKKYQIDQAMNLAIGAVDAGPAVGGKLSKNLLAKLSPNADEVARVEGQIMRESQMALDASNNQGVYQSAYTKMKNFVRLAGEKKSQETGELFREHIPQSVFGQSSDELAQSLGMTENELMAKIQQDIANPTPKLRTTGHGNYTNVKSIDNKILDDGWDDLLKGAGKESSTVADDIKIITNKKATPAVSINPFDDIVNRPEINVKQKVNLIDWLRTPNRVLNKIGLGEEAKGLRVAYDKYVSELPTEIDKITAWSKRVNTPGANERIFNYLDGKLPRLDNPTELQVATEIKSYLKDWATKLKLPEQNQISNYITHIFEKGKITKEFDPEVAKLIRGQVSKSVFDPFLQKRVGQPEYITDTWRALDAYVKKAVRKYSLDPILEKIAGKAENLPEESYNYVKSQIARVNMQPTAIDNLIDNAVKSSPIGYNLGQRPLTSVTKKARQAIFRGLLGLNPASALRNMSQAFNAYPELKEKYFLQGAIKTIMELPNLIANKSTELEKSGVLGNMVEDRSISATKKFWQNTDEVLFYMFNLAEKWNRGIAYYGGKAKALAEGKTTQEAIEYAKRLVRDTQFSYDVVDTPAVLQSDLAKTIFQFGTYPLKQGEFLIEMAKRKDIAGSIRWLAANLLFIGTVGEILGMGPTDLIPQFKFGTPPTLQAPVGVYDAITKTTDNFGNELTPTERILNKNLTTGAVNYIPAGGEMRKIWEGINSMNQGGSYSPSGRLRYPVEKNIPNAILGTNVTKEAQNYYDNKITPLGPTQTEQYKQMIQSGMTPTEAYKVFTDKRAEDQQFEDIINKKEDNGFLGTGLFKKKAEPATDTTPTTTGNRILDLYNQEKADSDKQTKIKAILELNLPIEATDKMLQQSGLGTIEDAQNSILKNLSVENRADYLKEQFSQITDQNKFIEVATKFANDGVLTTGITAQWLDEGVISTDQQKALNNIINYAKNKISTINGNPKRVSLPRPTLKKLSIPKIKTSYKTIKVEPIKPLKPLKTSSSLKDLQRRVAQRLAGGNK